MPYIWIPPVSGKLLILKFVLQLNPDLPLSRLFFDATVMGLEHPVNTCHPLAQYNCLSLLVEHMITSLFCSSHIHQESVLNHCRCSN